MAAKVVYKLREEDKREIGKQLGCLNGIFQLFDRRYLLGQHRHGRNQRQTTLGQSDNGKRGFKNASEKTKDKSPRKVMIEKHKVSIEPSRNSFSSSCSSTTLSSLDCSKRVQTELTRIVSEPTSPYLHKKQPNSSLQAFDIRDVVKDAMTRKTRVVSVRTVAKDEQTGPVMKHVDSPRPFVYQKPVQYDRKDVKEPSRFSCDGRELRCSVKSTLKVKDVARLSLDSKQNNIRESMDDSSRNLLNQTHEPGSNKRPLVSVVAKLMGLEGLTDSIDEVETFKIKSGSDDEVGLSSRWSRKGEEFKETCVSSGDRGSKKPALEKKEAPVSPKNGSASVYGEMEKRLTKLEFKTSGKDLRALKQILEAMQTTQRGVEKNEQFPKGWKSDQQVSPSIKATGLHKLNHADSNHKVNHADSKQDLFGTKPLKHQTPRKNKATGKTQKNMPEYLTVEKSSLSPRRKRSKNGLEKQSVRKSPSDSSRIKMRPDIQPVLSNLKTQKPKSKPVNPLKNNEQSCNYSTETRSLNQDHDHDTVSFKSESNTSQNELEVTKTENHKNNFEDTFIEDKPMVELAKLTVEQQSPVSVLDAFYTEDTPSPVKNKPNAFNDYENSHFDETEWNQVETNDVKPEKTNHLIDQIELLNSANDEANLDGTESYRYESKNYNHGYIKEILLASGFLKDLDYATRMVQLHPSGTLIDPNLFHDLEKTKGCTRYEKTRRKMVFDTVNDILFRKLDILGSLWTSKRQARLLNGEKLVKELCLEIDDLQTSSNRCLYDEDDEVKELVMIDVNKKSEDWGECQFEVSGLVLDIERLIFKDLINEIVNAEVGSLQDRSGRRCKQSFPV